ncbi:hypothetical protein KQY30_33585 [Streptomyces sp. GMY02]|uniref:nuclear transport factor 2 family protein n=1 Tax=Streptomyces sp. GMY02 TaxID=1333528 RepID=UPI001C2BF412|nr:hypothetical protein [Streptomyces sp. GMY02]QXE38435.1 hypothetical protein KQY30_33585 [Streptomyces sp. GMY02]
MVDGEHFFDILAEDVVTDYVVSVPGYPHQVEGRRGNCRPIPQLRRHDGPVRRGRVGLHHDTGKSVVVLVEYAVHGRAVHTGRAYDNHFVSVITIKDRQVTHWRDYLDPIAAFQALGRPTEPR